MNPLLSMRGLVTGMVRARVYYTIRQHQNIVRIRRYQVSTILLATWRPYMVQVRMMSTVRSTSWILDWLPAWRPQQPAVLTGPPTPTVGPSGGGSRSGKDSDPRHISVQRLRDMLDSSSDYVVHGTRNRTVGTCQTPVEAETDQALMSNPMQPIGIYGFRGLRAALSTGYGPYAVVFRYTTRWRQFEAAVIHHGTGTIPDDEVVGWFDEDDLAEADRLRRGE
jgi:hypothetical protein